MIYFERTTDMIIISACLMGKNCKYNGKNNLRPELLHLKDEAVLICPEAFGKMPIPRMPSEIEPGFSGGDVLDGKARVFSSDGKDVTEHFIKGSEKVLETAVKHGITKAYLKQSSPSCGCGKIYDGTFSDVKKSGDGVLTALLKRNGIEVTGIE